MSKKVKAIVVNSPKIGTDGRADVVLADVIDGTVTGPTTAMGYILQTRLSGVFRAHSLEDSHLGDKPTRSQAMHLIQRNFEGREAKRALNGSTPAPATISVVVAAETPAEPTGLTRAEAAEKLGISRGALSKRIKRGTVKTDEAGLVILG